MRLLPGLLLCALLAVASRWLSSALDAANPVLFAIVIGTALAPAAKRFTVFAPGIQSGARVLLPVALALLGLRVDLKAFGELGIATLLVTVFAITATIAGCFALCARAGIERRLGGLIGVGTAICGGSAIVAVAPVLKAKETEISLSIATVSLFGTLAMIALPPLGALLDLGQVEFGTWAGASLQLVPQAVACGMAYGSVAGQIATVVKMGRVLLLAPVVIVLGLLEHRREPAAALGWQSTVPPFIIGYLVLLVAKAMGLVPTPVIHWGSEASRALLLTGMAAVGFGTDFSALMRSKGTAMLLGLLATVLICTANALLFLI